jgi:acetyl esterase
VVVSVILRTAPREPSPAAFHDAVAALEWAADHGSELDADPSRLLVAGEGTGAAVAGAMAMHARDNWWPGIARQILIHPVLGAWHPSVPYVSALHSAPVAGVAPATIVASAAPRDGGRVYAARLRGAGVEVDELRHADPGAALADLARALRAE